MTTINLSHPMQPGNISQRSESGDKGIYISIAVLVITILIYGGLAIGKTMITSKQKDIEDQIAAQKRNLDSSNVERVADFQERLNKIDENSSVARDPNEILRQVENAVLQGVIVTSLESTHTSFVVEFITGNFQTVAEQMESFKRSNYFKNLKINEITRDPKGKIIVKAEMGF